MGKIDQREESQERRMQQKGNDREEKNLPNCLRVAQFGDPAVHNVLLLRTDRLLPGIPHADQHQDHGRDADQGSQNQGNPPAPGKYIRQGRCQRKKVIENKISSDDEFERCRRPTARSNTAGRHAAR